MRPRRFSLIATFTLTLVGCAVDRKDPAPRETASAPPAPTITPEQQKLLDELAAKKQEAQSLSAEPGRYLSLEPGSEFVDRGIIHTFTQITAIVLKNSSRFDVSGIAGELTYRDEKGDTIATVPFTADGSIDAGGVAKLTVHAKEITGSSRKFSVHFQHVTVHGA